MEQVIKNLDRRVLHVEEILPTLATKHDVEGLATKEELRQGLEANRRHTQMLFESLQHSIQVLADGIAHVTTEVEATNRRLSPRIEDHEVRILALEADQRGHRRRPTK